MKRYLSILLTLILLAGTLGLFATGTYAEEASSTAEFGTVYEDNFNSYTPGTYTAAEFRSMLGWGNFTDVPGTVYQITDNGKMRIHVPYQNPDFTQNKMNTQLFVNIGEFDKLITEGKIIIEFERTLNESVTHGAFYSMIFVGKDTKNFVEPNLTAQGFNQARIRKNDTWVMQYQNRPQYIPFNRLVNGYNYAVGDNYGTPITSHYCTFGSTDVIRMEIDRYTGISTFVNGQCIKVARLSRQKNHRN